ncbi:hypothetical protein HELRODRAFT_158346 [Helobdella robusta]|uniref:Uncharacterized protein n=1 Tax=Helobdella robusta TaxID=6412 RepID=T1EMP0_HELRO|nr:hypothetical protein HELRODRAFT_158346 [Helobdella robusta]ESO11970.1 hypothetical protein HELRODRAFT_158346 [Helobdella robusta]
MKLVEYLACICYLQCCARYTSGSKFELCSQVHITTPEKQTFEVFHIPTANSSNGCWCHFVPQTDDDLEIKIIGFQSLSSNCKSKVTFEMKVNRKSSKRKHWWMQKCLHGWIEPKIELEFEDVTFVNISYKNNMQTSKDTFQIFLQFETGNVQMTCNIPQNNINNNNPDITAYDDNSTQPIEDLQDNEVVDNQKLHVRAIVSAMVAMLIILLLLTLGAFLLRKRRQNLKNNKSDASLQRHNVQEIVNVKKTGMSNSQNKQATPSPNFMTPTSNKFTNVSVELNDKQYITMHSPSIEKSEYVTEDNPNDDRYASVVDTIASDNYY